MIMSTGTNCPCSFVEINKNEMVFTLLFVNNIIVGALCENGSSASLDPHMRLYREILISASALC